MYMNDTSYLIKNKTSKNLKLIGNLADCNFKIYITQKLSDLITDVQCIKTRKADIKTVSTCIYVPTFLIINFVSK